MKASTESTRPLRRADGTLETRVVTYFPPGAGVLLTRLNEDELEIQLVRVDEAGGVTPVGSQAAQLQQRTAEPQAVHREPIGEQRHFQGVIWPERQPGLLQRAGDFLRRLLRREFHAGKLGQLRRRVGDADAELAGVHAGKAASGDSTVNAGGAR